MMMTTSILKDNVTDVLTLEFSIAVNVAKFQMSVEMTRDSIAKLEKRAKNENGTLTVAQVDALKDDITSLKKDLKDYEKIVEKNIATYNKVVGRIAGATSGDFSNDEKSVKNLLNILACAENSKLTRYAIKLENDTLYDCFAIIHDVNNSGEYGKASMTKAVKDMYEMAQEEIDKMIKDAISIHIANDYTKKVNIKFNKTTMRRLHESYITGYKVEYDIKKDKDGKEVSRAFKGYKANSLITCKVSKDGKKTYNFSKFNAMIVNLTLEYLA